MFITNNVNIPLRRFVQLSKVWILYFCGFETGNAIFPMILISILAKFPHEWPGLMFNSFSCQTRTSTGSKNQLI